jgi:hypothetical protein
MQFAYVPLLKKRMPSTSGWGGRTEEAAVAAMQRQKREFEK